VRRLNGASVALLEARMSAELASLVRRYGGLPRLAPAVREVATRAPREVAAFLDRLCAGQFALVIFLTGSGVTALIEEARAADRLDDAIGALQRVPIACRGSKPIGALRKHGVPTTIAAREPFTTVELLQALDRFEFAAATVALVHYGERSVALASALEARGARLDEICLYEWQLPDAIEPLCALVRDVIAGGVDAVAFTSKVQCTHLFLVAAQMGCDSALASALNDRTTVAVIGPVCRAALREHGVISHVMPATPKMAPLVAAIAEYFEHVEHREP
jgi:uroporphyrinogen-III synthase